MFYRGFVAIIMSVIGVLILYIGIETAVRCGINSAVIGQALEKKKSFFDNDLDDD